MPSFPVGVQTVTVTVDCRHPDGNHFKGNIVFAPEPASVTSATHDVIVLGDVSVKPDPTTGLVVVTLLATDAEGFTPAGWTYRVYEKWLDAARRDYPLSLPAAIPTVNLADYAPTDPAEGEYIVVRGPQGIQGPKGDKGDPGTGGGAVDSVNGQTGIVILDAADIGADPAGAATTAQTAAVATAATDATTKANAAQSAATTAAAADATSKAGTAQAAAISAAATDATAKVTAHTAASDPHGDRASATTALTTHVGAADPHGDRAWASGQFDNVGAAATAQAAAISTAASDATAKVAAHTAASDPHGDRAAAASALATHAADSTVVHGITDTAALVLTTDPRLDDDRTPTAHASTHAAAGSDPVTPAAIGAYTSTDGNTLNGYVTDLQNRVGGAFGLENRATALESGRLQVASNLSDLASAATARTNLGLGTAATAASSAFDAAGSAAAALAAAEDYTDAHAGGGGVRTAQVRITDDNLSGLPSAAAWAVVLTSAGTPLQCSIPAADGDRIRVYGRYMRAGSHFLDWVLLSSAGAIAIYAGTDTSSPLSEGDPALYPSLSFLYDPGPPMFTVGSGHIDGSGNITIGLAHQGTGGGTVYAHTSYPWKLRLENIGPEPA